MSDPLPSIDPQEIQTHLPLHGRAPSLETGWLAPPPVGHMAGSGLPERWQNQAQFVIFENEFGVGSNFLATWAAWQADPKRCARLFFLSATPRPLAPVHLASALAHSSLPLQAQALLAAWPAQTPGLHRLDFDGGAVTLLLWAGALRDALSGFRAEVDAFFLGAMPPENHPEMEAKHTLQALARLARAGATAAVASDAPRTRDALRQAGFAMEPATDTRADSPPLQARWMPAFAPPRPAAHRPLAPNARRAVVLGAGIAGAACAQALRREGLEVRVLDALTAPAQGASGNPGGLFHGSVHPDDGPHARWNRACALRAAQALQGHSLSWCQMGLLRRSPGHRPEALQALIERQALAADYLQALPAPDAAALSGLPLDDPAWYYPQGGALPPAERVAALLDGVDLRLDTPVAHIEPAGAGWRLLGPQGQVLDETPLLILATGHRTPALVQPWDPDLAGRLIPQRGQVSVVPAEWAARAARPLRPVAGGGYVITLPDGRVVAGSTAQAHDHDPNCREADSAHNLDVWQRLCGAAEPPPADWPAQLPGRVSWRLLAPDKLPVIGGLPLEAPTHRATQAAHWPRRPGLVLCTALASRGLTWAALASELAVALALGLPAPVESRLIDAVDPARFRVRGVRRG